MSSNSFTTLPLDLFQQKTALVSLWVAVHMHALSIHKGIDIIFISTLFPLDD